MKEIDYKIIDFTKKDLGNIYENRDKAVFVYSPNEIKFLSETSPLTVKRINKKLRRNYPVREENLYKQAKTICSFLIHTIDSSIFHGRMKPEMVKSKIRHINGAYECIGRRDFLSEEDCTEENKIDYAFTVKSNALDIPRRFEKTFESYNELVPEDWDINVTDFFRNLLGDNLKNIVMYGSYMNGEGKDVDILLLVDRFDRGFYNIIEGKGKKVPFEKPVNIVGIPYDFIETFCDIRPRSRGVALGKSGKIVFGPPIIFPVISVEDEREKILFATGKNFTGLRGSLGDEGRINATFKSAGLFDYTIKQYFHLKKDIQKMRKDFDTIDIGYKQPSNFADMENLLFDLNLDVKKEIDLLYEK